MRALYYTKIDYMLTRKQMRILPFFFLLALFVSRSTSEGGLSLLVGCSYVVFIASIFSTAPFAYSGGKNKGFLLLFPATVKDRVTGRFLYGLSFVAMLGLLCAALFGICKMTGMEVSRWMIAAGLCELAIGIVLVTLQNLFFYLFGEGKDNWQYLNNIVRTAPGMAMFFGTSALVGEVQDAAAAGTLPDLETLSGKMMQAGVVSVAAALLLTVIAAVVCAKVISRRDYA